MELRVLGWLTLLFIPKDNLNPTSHGISERWGRVAMFNHDLRSFSLNLLYLIFSILTWTG